MRLPLVQHDHLPASSTHRQPANRHDLQPRSNPWRPDNDVLNKKGILREEILRWDRILKNLALTTNDSCPKNILF